MRLTSDDLERGMPDDDAPIAARELIEPGIGRGAPIVVVCAPPGGDVPVLDRRVTDGLRAFAAAASEMGAAAVITVPSLPSSLAQRILSGLSRVADDWTAPPSALELAELVRNLRWWVHAAGPRSAATDRERMQIAMDVCLYVNDPYD
jgi:hypothetical protein